MPSQKVAKLPIVPEAKASNFSPTQILTLRELERAIDIASLVIFETKPGFGKTTLTDHVLAHRPGVRVSLGDFIDGMTNAPTPALEGTLFRTLDHAMDRADLVVVDDFDMIGQVIGVSTYLRWGLPDYGLHAFIDRARERGKCLVFTGSDFRSQSMSEHFSPSVFEASMYLVEPPALEADDYGFFLGLALEAATVKSIPLKRIFEHAPGLNGHQLRFLGALLAHYRRTDERLIREIIDTQLLLTNTDTGEVANVSFADLKGFERIVETLTTYVINPLKADPRFDNIGLAPKRGVLLYGPPGTGKTSIGRALAHQMEGKFFIFDGTVQTDPAAKFYSRVDALFSAAKKAAPCVLFIDDADVLFQSDRSNALTRYLLSMLDGLESETAGKVAVIMTAMNPNHMPPALLRSGRVELWLETKPPSQDVRAQIVAADVASLPKTFHDYDFSKIATLTAGFNAADMRRIVADVKALYARDIVRKSKPQSTDDYFGIAAQGVRRNKELLGLAETGQLKLGAQ